jgi:hypothetical protein
MGSINSLWQGDEGRDEGKTQGKSGIRQPPSDLTVLTLAASMGAQINGLVLKKIYSARQASGGIHNT